MIKNKPLHPIIKWTGSKRSQASKIIEFIPDKKYDTYYEPFVGSGAVFFDVVQKFKLQSAWLYDINEELILTYKVI